MISVLLVDDEQLVRSGLRMILDAAEDIAVVGEAEDGAAAVRIAAETMPDVVLLDIRMPGMDGLSATPEIMGLAQPPRVVLLTTFDLDDYVHRGLRAGAVGFLLKDIPPRELAAAVRTVHAGNAMLAPSVTKRMLHHFAVSAPNTEHAQVAAARLEIVSERERSVLEAVARGMSNAEAGRLLDMREATVKTHVSRILSKLGLANRVQAAILAHDAGWV